MVLDAAPAALDEELPELPELPELLVLVEPLLFFVLETEGAALGETEVGDALEAAAAAVGEAEGFVAVLVADASDPL